MTLNILIPMAGGGTRFKQAGFRESKPFIDVNGKPMIARVMENLAVKGARFILVARREDASRLRTLDCDTVSVDTPTEGAACTALLAKAHIDNVAPLLIANSDQLVDIPIADFVADMLQQKLDGLIMTFREPSRDPKWSYVRRDEKGFIVETKEKVAISDEATAGIYLFATGSDFVHAAQVMIGKNDRTNGEFYICPAYNYLIAEGKRIGAYPIAAEAMHGLGTPEDLARYLEE